jgi:hypothetical protein
MGLQSFLSGHWLVVMWQQQEYDITNKYLLAKQKKLFFNDKF